MANPFPGMDPYLEGPFWSVVHHNLIEQMAFQLSAKIRPKYLALTEERIVVATPDDIERPARQERLPDVAVFGPPGLAGTATSVIAGPFVMEAVIPEQMKQSFVEIRDAKNRRLITAIELLSPTNKRGDGLMEYRKKRNEYLTSEVHFVEIDLLRIGERFPVRGPLPSVPYFVFLSRAHRRPRLDVWPIALNQPLPTVHVPLAVGDDDTTLDLQQALTTAYNGYGYDDAVDHSSQPTVPLDAAQSEWTEGCLRQAGMR